MVPDKINETILTLQIQQNRTDVTSAIGKAVKESYIHLKQLAQYKNLGRLYQVNTL